MLQKLKKNQSGFSIVEVMIVLAIAGLIILVVFLAVPALNRNSRNTTVKNDASAISGAVSEYRAANGGANPTGSVTISGESGTIGSVEFKVSQVGTATIVTAEPTAALAQGTVNIVTGRKCTTTSTSTWTTALTAPAARSAAIIYPTELGGSSYAKNCLDA